MPRITRYFPVSHDINSDHEVWEMRDTIGEKSLSIWLELLSIADRNGGALPPCDKSFSSSVAFKCHTKPSLVQQVWYWGCSRHWIVINPTPTLRSYAKFHKTRGDIRLPPKQPSETTILKMHTAPSADPVDKSKEQPKKRGLDPRVKVVADRIFLSDQPRFARLVVWIKDKEKRDYPPEVIAETLALFEMQDKKTTVKDWWPYLDRIHTKVYGQWNELQAAKVKGEESKFVSKVVRSLAGGMT